MGLTKKTRLDAALEACAYAALWWIMYGLPDGLLGAGHTDAAHVLFEGTAALLLIVPAARDKATREALSHEGGTKPRYAVIAMALVPVFLLRFASDQAYCLTDAAYHGGNIDAVMRPDAYPWYVLRTCVTAPLMEELGCRWIAFGKLRRGYGFWPSALASAALFCLIHVDVNTDLALMVIPGAILYCLVYELTGKVRYCVASHAAYNVMCLPASTPLGAMLESKMFGVPRSIGIPFALASSAITVLLCVFRKRLFYSRSAQE